MTFHLPVSNGEREKILNKLLSRLIHNKVSRRYSGAVVVRELHQKCPSKGKLHYHLLINAKGTDLKNDEVALLREIRFWQGCVRRYRGLGYRNQFEPLLSAKGYAEYLAAKFHLPLIGDDLGRKQRVTYVGDAKVDLITRSDFSFVAGYDRATRKKLALLAKFRFENSEITSPTMEGLEEYYKSLKVKPGISWRSLLKYDLDGMQIADSTLYLRRTDEEIESIKRRASTIRRQYLAEWLRGDKRLNEPPTNPAEHTVVNDGQTGEDDLTPIVSTDPCG